MIIQIWIFFLRWSLYTMSNRITDSIVSFDILNVLIRTFNITYVAFTLFAVNNTGL